MRECNNCTQIWGLHFKKYCLEVSVTVDIHSHILPGVDDGAEDFAEAVDMLRIAAVNGTTDIVLSPHFLTTDMRSSNLDKKALEARFNNFKSKISEQLPNINLYFGAEVFGVSNIEDFLEDGEIIPINGNKYVLTEFDFDDSPKRALEITKALIGSGYSVVIAHPERYSFVQYEPRLIVPFLEEGAVLQINAASILGANGPIAEDVALSFLENQLAAVVASDCHSAFYRSPDLSEAYSFVSSQFSPEYADNLFTFNPLSIINGKRL